MSTLLNGARRPWGTIGGVIAVIVLVADVALLATHAVDVPVGAMIGGLAVARLT